MTARQADEAKPEAAAESAGPPPKPGALRRMVLQPLINWWPVTFTAVAATALASSLYVAAALVFQAGRIDYGLGFALGGLAMNAMPPASVWAVMKWVR